MTKWTRSATWATAGALGIGFLLGGAVAKDSSLFGPTVAAWAQFCGSMLALAVAIAVPWWQEQTRQAREKADLLERRRAAYRAMHAVIETLAPHQLWLAGEIEGAARPLDSLDLSVFTVEAMQALVGLQARIGKAAAEIQNYRARGGHAPMESNFDGEAARRNLLLCAASMGVD